MALPGYIRTLLGGLQDDVKRVLVQVFEEVIPNNRFGPVDHRTKAANFQAYFLNSTTASDTSEFTISHGLGRVPYMYLPVGALDQVGAKLPNLEVTRAADAMRLYFKSSDTSTPFSILVE